MKEMFYTVIMVVITQLNAFVKIHQIVHLKSVDFIVHNLYFTEVDHPKN